MVPALGWISSVGAVVLYGPPWAITTVLAASVAVGVDRAARSTRRRDIGAAVVAATLVALTIVVEHISLAGTPAEPGPLPATLHVRLTGVDETLHTASETSLPIFYGDHVTFRVPVRNDANRASPAFYLVVGSGADQVLVAAGTTRWNTRVRASLGLAAPLGEHSELEEVRAASTIADPAGRQQMLPRINTAGGYRVAEPFRGSSTVLVLVPSIAAHREATVTVSAEIRTEGFAWPSSGERIAIEDRTTHTTDKNGRLLAATGDLLGLSIRIHDPGREAVSAFVRLAVSHGSHGVELALSDTADDEEDPVPIATARLDGASGIALVPGSTYLDPEREPGCPTRSVIRLPDGLAEGGVDLGSIGSMTPRATCQGPYLTQYLHALARVS